MILLSPCSVLLFVDAYETAKMLCQQYYQVAPDLEVEEFNGNGEVNLTDVHKKKHFSYLWFLVLLMNCKL